MIDFFTDANNWRIIIEVAGSIGLIAGFGKYKVLYSVVLILAEAIHEHSKEDQESAKKVTEKVALKVFEKKSATLAKKNLDKILVKNKLFLK